MQAPRRALVLTAETARHPFRRTLPPHVLQPLSDDPPARRSWRPSRRDARDFFTSYCTAFAAVAVFIS